MVVFVHTFLDVIYVNYDGLVWSLLNVIRHSSLERYNFDLLYIDVAYTRQNILPLQREILLRWQDAVPSDCWLHTNLLLIWSLKAKLRRHETEEVSTILVVLLNYWLNLFSKLLLILVLL